MAAAASNLVIFLPMATPEVVMGASLLAMFVSLGFDSILGFTTLVIAHTLFCLSFVVVTVKARLAGMDSRLEQAAMDLYANEWQTFRLVTLPLALPGIVAAALLGVLAVVRRLHRLELHRRPVGDLPALHLRQQAQRTSRRSCSRSARSCSSCRSCS